LNSKDKKAFLKNIIGPHVNIDVDDEAVSVAEDQLLFIYPWVVLTDNWKEWEEQVVTLHTKKKETGTTSPSAPYVTYETTSLNPVSVFTFASPNYEDNSIP
jgi:hypothetical protein